MLFALGKDVSGESKFADLAKMPHLLVAGATNSGKSVCLNTLIASLLYRATPDELKLILIDPKRVELSLFDGIPHLACPVIKDARQAAGIFRAATKEMDNRYELIARAGCRNIQSYNEKQPEGERLPYLVIVCDELADLMLQAAAEVETSICRLAQLARAVGIHLVIATQRPSVDVITGLIKANISSRIAFAVSQQVDSRTILDKNGAERLIGRGDMLFLPIDAQKPLRIQGCYLSEDEIHRIVDFLKSQRKPVYTIEATDITVGGSGGAGDDGGTTDPLYQQAVRMIVTSGYASTSMIQRKFKIGYPRSQIG
ncbi:MAG TPA: DNA translocase FtsK [Armatimonadota bacterium]|nr:DNA translocase FtsK [Armatimonadota bacterium]